MKVALIGSAPSSIRNAPYHDPSWEIWGCSPGAYGVIPRGRSNQWWELHVWEPGQVWFSPEYCQFLKDHPHVVVSKAVDDLPNGKVLNYQYLVNKYGPYFFTSSIAWMMAAAIEAGAEKIGLWGVDMAANEEYEAQRAGLHYFAQIAQGLGIEVGVPKESDLFRPRFLYGIDENTHAFTKVRARRAELHARLSEENMKLDQAKQGIQFLNGALDDLNYMHQTWVDRSEWCGPPVLFMPEPEVPKLKKQRKPRQATEPDVVPR